MVNMKPKNIEFEITTACNYVCIHCYCNAGRKSRVELTTDEIFDVIDQLVEADVEVLDIVGGEPLLRNDLIDIFAYGKSKGLNMMMNTNAALATREMVKKIRNVVPELTVGVSLDGPSATVHDKIRGVGSFERTYEGLTNFLDAGFDVTILFVVNKINYQYIQDMIDLAKELGANLYVDRFIPVGRGILNRELLLPTRNMIDYVAQKLKDYKDTRPMLYIEENIFGEDECSAGKTHASILVDGNVVPCGHFRYLPEFYVGNVKEQRFKEIWSRMNDFRKRLIPEQCIRCALRKFDSTNNSNIYCLSGCLAAALFDKTLVDTRVCKIHNL
ncbi:MAG: radical SAM protein [Fervidobacterium sp.]